MNWPIEIYLDGDQWCALMGENLQEGLAGSGNTPGEALRALSYEIDLYGPVEVLE